MKQKLIFLMIIFIILSGVVRPAGAKFNLILNFDDGYEGVYRYAFPLLNKYNLPAVTFVTVKLIGKDRHLTLKELQELKRAGWEIGSHTINHPDLSELTEEGQEYELRVSKEYLLNRGLLETDYASFASPKTVWNSQLERIVKSNYQVARGKKLFDYRENIQQPSVIKVVVKNTSLKSISLWIEKAVREDRPLILVFHEVGQGGNIYFYPPDKFARLVELIKDYPVTTFYALSDKH